MSVIYGVIAFMFLMIVNSPMKHNHGQVDQEIKLEQGDRMEFLDNGETMVYRNDGCVQRLVK